MKRFDKILFGFVIGFIFPIMIGLLSVLIWFYADRQEIHAPIYALIGLSSGLLIDLVFLKRWINKRYMLPIWFAAGIYIFYNICVYGFFMGFPVFNVLLGLLAGYYFGNRICSNRIQPEMRSKLINQVSLFTGLIMTLICVSSGVIGLTDKTVGENIRGMLGLDFEITKTMILAIIFIGGFGLIVSQYFVTKLTMRKTIRLNN
jgi:hypothetical protein